MNSSISNIILDFDGTLTDVEKEAGPFLERWETSFSEFTGLPKEKFLGQAEEIRKETRSNPREGWVYQGLVVAPATADPYVLTTTTYRRLIEKLRKSDLTAKLPAEAETGEFLDRLFGMSYAAAGLSFREGAHEFIKTLELFLYKMAIVTNSKTESVEKKLRQLGDFEIPIIGGAKKYAVDQTWDQVPETLQPEGFPRPVFLRRKKYYEVLCGLREIGFEPENTAVIGDIFELDLALPQYLGYKIILLETAGTQTHEKPYLQSQPNSFLAKNFAEVIEVINLPK